MSHDCDKLPYLEQLKENYENLRDDVNKLDDNHVELTKAITKLASVIETNRYWHKMTVTILSITLAVIFGILQVCLNMI